MRSILVHGGAGTAAPDDDAARAKAGCLEAARAGLAVLARGGSALDAVEAAVRRLEDDPAFNAGLGSALNADGEVALDASIMDGATLGAGAVAAVKTFKNPVTLARAVMEKSPHLLLVGAGAQQFGRSVGLDEVDPASLVTPKARLRFERKSPGSSHGTVGAVAVDDAGHVAAATSTGGTSRKLPGRVGDSPLIGCGTYADDRLGAASATGLGEAIIRVTLTRHVLDLVGTGLDPTEAARRAVGTLARVGGSGGLIVVAPDGRLGWFFDTQRMAYGWIDRDGREGCGFERQD